MTVHASNHNGNGNIHSTKIVSDHLMEELINAMKDVDAFGSVEIILEIEATSYRSVSVTFGEFS